MYTIYTRYGMMRHSLTKIIPDKVLTIMINIPTSPVSNHSLFYCFYHNKI